MAFWDQNAGYLGILERVNRGGGSVDLAIVVGITEVRHRIVTFQYYRHVDGHPTFDDLLSRVKAVMADAVTQDASDGDEAPSGTTPSRSGETASFRTIDWNGALGKTILAAIAVALIGGIAFLFRALRGK